MPPFESLDQVPEEVRPLYEETSDGKVQFKGIPDVSGLKKKADELLSEAKAAKAKLRDYEGIDPEEYRKLKEAAAKADEKAALDSGDLEKVRAELEKQHKSSLEQVTTKHSEEISARDEKLSALTQQLEQEIIDAKAITAIVEAGGEPKLLLPIVKGRMKVVEEDGKRFARVVGDDGTVRVGSDGKPMALSELVEELKSDDAFSRAFDASGASGSSSRRSVSRGGESSVSVEQAGNMSMAEYRAARKKGLIK